jgi:DNA-nicking Smr family endonuclease
MGGKKEQPGRDIELFREALDGVTPLPSSGRITSAKTPRRAVPRKPSIQNETSDTLSDQGIGEEALTEFLRNGISRMTLRKLRRGHWPVQDSLDLHGMRSNEARQLLPEFLHQASQQGLHCVCVVHGKGWHSQSGEGILKIRARHWLTQCAEVLAFCEAPQNMGGAGAVLVLLKNKV